MIIVMGLLLCLIGAQAAFADLNGDATAHVYVDVVPNVAVGVLTGSVDIGEIQTGDFSATITFRVDANMQDVYLSAAASPLYKGDDPTNTEVAPLPLLESAGILFEPTNANPMNGGSNVASYTGDTTIDGFPGLLTGQIQFESSQNGHFSQDVDLTVYWQQPDPEQPQGQYSGLVQMFCLLMPS